jgi:integrase
MINGKRCRFLKPTKEEAMALDNEAKLRIVAGPSSIAKQISLKDAIRRYYSTVSPNKDSHANEKHYFSILFEFLTSPDFAGEEIFNVDEVKLFHLQALQTHLVRNKVHSTCFKKEREEANEQWSLLQTPKRCAQHPDLCRGKPVSPSTVNRFFSTYLDFFNRCDDWELLSKNPVTRLQPMKESPAKKKVHPPETVQAVIDDLESRDEDWAADALFCMNGTGARPSELKRLRWRDVDRKEGLITLRSKKGDGEMKERQVPLSPSMMEFFNWKFEKARRRFVSKNEDQVFLSATGCSFNSKAFARAVARSTARLGIEDFTAYCTRHGFVTKLRRMGVAIADIGDLAGHSNLNTTRNIYSHMDGEHLRPVVTQLAEFDKVQRRSGK